MDEFKYPLRFMLKNSGEVVEFVGPHEGTVIDAGSGGKSVGYHSTTFFHHTEIKWIPVEMPQSTKRKLHEAVKQFTKGH